MAFLPTNSTVSPQKRSTGFTNLQRYLSANTGNRLGTSIGSGITSSAQGVQTGLQDAQQQFQQQAKTNDLASSENQAARAAVLQRLSGSMVPAVNQSEVSDFSKYRAGQYGGPRELSDTDTLLNKAREAENLGKSTSSEEGRSGLLQRFVGSPQYTQGQQRFDNLLLGQAPELSQARQKTVGLSSAIGRENQRAGAQASQLTENARKFGEETSGMIGSQKQGVDTTLQNQLTAAQAAAKGMQGSFATGQKAGTVSGKNQPPLGS